MITMKCFGDNAYNLNLLTIRITQVLFKSSSLNVHGPAIKANIIC